MPHDDVSGRRILGAGEMTAEPGDLGQIERERPGCGRMVSWVGNQAIEDARFELAEHEDGFEVRLDPVEHRQPKHVPAQDTEQRDQPDQSLGGPQACLPCPTGRNQAQLVWNRRKAEGERLNRFPILRSEKAISHIWLGAILA